MKINQNRLKIKINETRWYQQYSSKTCSFTIALLYIERTLKIVTDTEFWIELCQIAIVLAIDIWFNQSKYTPLKSLPVFYIVQTSGFVSYYFTASVNIETKIQAGVYGIIIDS